MKKKQIKDQKSLHSFSQIESPGKKDKVSKSNFSKLLFWGQKISSHPHLYFPSIEDQKDYHYFRIILQDLKDFDIGSVRRKSFIQFSCILFNLSTSAYIGQTYFSQMFDVQTKTDGRTSLNSLKSIYVYTGCENVSLKVDVWRLESEKGKSGFQLMVKRIFLGHFDIDLTAGGESGKRQKQLINNEEERFFSSNKNQEEDIEQSKLHSRLRHNCKIVYQVLNTHSLTYLHHFVPPDVICDENDQILGLKNNRISPNGEIVSDQRSKLRFQIQQIVIPRLLIKTLVESAQQKINLSFQIVGKSSYSLKQIILHLEFHNGWRTVCQQVLPLKEKEDQSLLMSKTKIEMKSTLKKAKINEPQYGKCTYMYEKMKELNAVYLNSGGAFIAWLQAKIEFKFDVKVNGDRKQKNDKVLIPFGFFITSLEDKQEEKAQKFQFFQGNPYNLTHLVQYFSFLKEKKSIYKGEDQAKMYCEMMFYLIKSKDDLQSIGKDTVEKDAHEIESLKAEKQRLIRMRRKLKEQKRKKLIEINQEIPFLDPTKIKEELYNQKIQKIKSQKQQKEDILFFLKAKVNQLERQALIQNYQSKSDDFGDDGLKSNLIHKMAENFIDYKADQNPVSLSQGLSIDIFNQSFCKKVQKPPSSIDKSIVSAFMFTKTYLNIEITKFLSYREEIRYFSIFIYDFSGKKHLLSPITSEYQSEERLSLNIPLPKNSFELIFKILNNLLNSFLPIYLQCENEIKIVGLTLINVDKLIESLEPGSICSSFIKQKAVFKQEETQLAEFQAIFSFNQSFKQNITDIQQNISMNISNLIQVQKKPHFLSRIDRYKEVYFEGKAKNQIKTELIEKTISKVPIQKYRFNYHRGVIEVIKLHVTNKSSSPKLLNIKILDEDEQYLKKPEANIYYKFINNKQQESTTMVEFRSNTVIEIQPNSTALLPLSYYSQRKMVNTNSLYFTNIHNKDNKNGSFLQNYTHYHKIMVTLTQVQSSLVDQMFQIEIYPEVQPNTLYLQTFITQKTSVVLPIPCKDLDAQNNEIEIKMTPTRAILNFPHLNPSESTLAQFSLMKTFTQNNQKTTFQNIQFYVRGSAHHEVQTRLWEDQDLLVMVPLSEIIKRQIEFDYEIQTLIIESKHVDLQLKSKQQYGFTTSLGFNRKGNDIFIRGRVTCNALGKQIYPIEVSDQHRQVIYRISVTNKVDFPTLTTQQILNIRIPKDDLDHSEPFQYENSTGSNLTFKTKSLKPQFLKIKQKIFDLKSKEPCEMTLAFNWARIKEEMKESQREQCQLLIGVVSRQVIDYFLFRCRSN